ncbi:MAG: Gfo/Idh/MocA family oxidoreductase [Pseudoxanthomonas sp.]
MKNVCLIGGGNITNLRHIPALLKHKARARITGVIGADEASVQRTAKRVGAKHALVASLDEATIHDIPWLSDIDLAVIGTPPRTHAALANLALRHKLNVLVEKPMTLEPSETKALAETARGMDRTLAVMHNFQYANGAARLHRLMQNGELGEISSFFMQQFTSRNRRLPVWYKDLPLGLFFDEASHFIYLLRRLGGPIDVLDAQGQFGPDPGDRTPILMNATMTAGGKPAQLSINFNAPVCEWMFIVSGSKKLACYDFFRDILIVLPNDGAHYAMDVLRTSALSTIGHWAGFIANGIRLVSGSLHYGVDQVVGHVLDALDGAPLPEEISAARGLETVSAMNRIAQLIEGRPISRTS